MKKIWICTIGDNSYDITRDIGSSKYVLLRNDEPIAVIIRMEYRNWKGEQIRYRPFSSPAELDYLDPEGLTALEDSIEYLNLHFGINECEKGT